MSRVYYGQSGYEGCSRSTRAVEAEEGGRLPLTRAIPVVARQAGVTQKKAREALIETHDGEWHHTGKHARRTNYYSIAAAVEFLVPSIAKARRIEEFRELLEARRDCTRRVRTHSTAANWRKFVEARAATRGLTNCYGGVYGGDPNTPRGDVAALDAELDRRAELRETNLRNSHREREAAVARLHAQQAKDRSAREAAVFANPTWLPELTDPTLRHLAAVRYAACRQEKLTRAAALVAAREAAGMTEEVLA